MAKIALQIFGHRHFRRDSTFRSWRRIDVPLMILVTMLSLLPAIALPAYARNSSTIAWSNTYQYKFGNDQASSVRQASDGGFVVAGHSFVAGGWVFKLNFRGDMEWGRTYIPTGYVDSWPTSVEETNDKSYIIGGFALSLRSATGYDGWLLKLDHKGNVQWSRIYGGAKDDEFTMAQPTSDGGYVAVGNTESFGSPYHASNGWILKLDSDGNVMWQETFEGEDVNSADQADDQGFIVAGVVGGFDQAAPWAFKLDPMRKAVSEQAHELSNQPASNSRY